MHNPKTKYKRSKNVFAVTCIAFTVGRDWPRLLQPLVQSLIGSSGTRACPSFYRYGGTRKQFKTKWIFVYGRTRPLT